MMHLEVLKSQPNFPNEDLTDSNAGIINYCLQEVGGERAYAEYLQKSMRALQTTAHEALRICGVQVDYSQDEYESFCGGFAAFEYASLLVNPRISKRLNRH